MRRFLLGRNRIRGKHSWHGTHGVRPAWQMLEPPLAFSALGRQVISLLMAGSSASTVHVVSTRRHAARGKLLERVLMIASEFALPSDFGPGPGLRLESKRPRHRRLQRDGRDSEWRRRVGRRAGLDAPRGVHHQPAAPVGWDALRGLRPCALLLTSTPARKVLSRSAGAGGPGQVSWTKSSDWQRSASWPPGAIYQGRLCAVRTVLPCQCPDEPCQASFGLSFRFDGHSRSGPRSRASPKKQMQQILAAKGRLDLFRAAWCIYFGPHGAMVRASWGGPAGTRHPQPAGKTRKPFRRDDGRE